MKLTRLVLPVILLLLVFSIEIKAQSLFQNDSVNSFNNEMLQKNSLLNKRMGFSVDVGVGFGASKYNSGSYTYVSPYLSYLVTPRFKLDVGATIQQGFGGNNTGGYSSFGNSGTNVSLFVRGDYLVSDRFIVSGSVYKTFDNYNTLNTDYNTKKNSFDNYGINMAMEYRLGKYMTIGAQIQISDGYYNQYNPFYQSQPSFGGFNSGFNHHSGFQRGMSGW